MRSKTLSWLLIFFLAGSLFISYVPTIMAATVEIRTDAATNVLATSATLEGYVINDGSPAQDGSETNLSTGFFYDTVSHPIMDYIAQNSDDVGTNSRGICTNGTYVWVTYPNAVRKFWASDNLTYIEQNGTLGSGNDSLNGPRGICTDDTYLWIADTGNNRIVKKWASNWTYINKVGSLGSSPNEFTTPTGICTDGTYLWITDYHSVIKHWASNLTYIARIGSDSSGNGNDQFFTPYHICTNGTYIYIVDANNQRIVKRWAADNLTYISQLGEVGVTGTDNNHFSNPYGIACNDTYIWVMDTGNDRIVRRWASNLTYQCKNGTLGTGNDQFDNPYAVCINDTQQRLWVIDTDNDRVVKRNNSFNTVYPYSTIASTTNVTGDSFEKSVTGLTPGQVYYYRAFGITENYTTNTLEYGDEVEFFTPPEPPTSVTSTIVNATSVNISWTTGTGANTTVVVRSTTALPTSVTDGTIMYNGTASYWVQTNLSDGDEYYYSLWSWANWSSPSYNKFSLTKADATWGGLVIYTFDENTSNAISGWDLFISNSSKTVTYESLTNSNPKAIAVADLPYGTDTMIRVNATNYNFKIYHLDLELNHHYVLNAYLTESNDTESYIIRVINEYENPVNDATVYVMRYINDTVGYENVSILLTDGNGYCPAVYLIPNEDYAVKISATGYITVTSELFPITIVYGDERYHVYTLYFEEEEYLNETIYDEIITFNGHLSGNTLYVNYTDSSSLTLNTSLVIYEFNTSTDLKTAIQWDNRTTDHDFQATFNVNGSSCFEVVLFLNHTTFGFVHDSFIVCGRTTITTKARFDTLLDLNFKHCPFGWSNLFGFFILLGCLFSFGQSNVGVSLLLCGGILAFINSVIGLAFMTVTVPTLFIFFGVLVLYSERGKGWK